MAFNPEYCVVVNNDDFKNGETIQLPLGCSRSTGGASEKQLAEAGKPVHSWLNFWGETD